jgi:hypothetical protein
VGKNAEMNKLLLIYGLFVVSTVGFLSFADAEEYTVDVPFDFHGVSCTFDEISIEYQCVWQGTQEVMSEEEIEQFKQEVAERLEARDDKIIEQLNEEALEQAEIEQAILTPNEKLIKSLEKKIMKGRANTADIVLLKMIKELDQCYQGIGRSEPIQNERSFEISLAENFSNADLGSNYKLKNLSLAIQECKGQQIMETSILSAQYDHFVKDKDDIWYDHRSLFEGVQAVPFDKFRETSTDIDISAICENNQFSIEHRKQFDCYIKGYMTNEQVNAENKINGYYNESGVITIKSEVFDRLNAFLEEYGSIHATIEDRQREADKASVIAEKLLQSNPWYERNN